MSERANGNQSTDIADKLKQALATLQEACDYALDTDSEPWEFAVPIRRLYKLGLNEADLRWLVQKAYVEHAREVTAPGDDGRQFRQTGNLTFTRRTCFVLTDAGAARASSLSSLSTTKMVPNETAIGSGDDRQAAQLPVVHWDAEARKLRVNGQVVKWFKWPAANQEAVLNAFQEESWPDRIDDPLPPQPEQDSKRRLSDTIKCLNRKQTNQLIHFRGDGTGEGVVWELVKPATEANGAE